MGKGLHNGKKSSITLKAAAEGCGIVFHKKTTSNQTVCIDACYKNVYQTQYATQIAHSGQTISTIEHLLSALYGFGIDNLIVEIEGDEVPILNGASDLFLLALEKAQIKEQSTAKKLLKVLKPIEVEMGDSYARILPFDGFKVDFKIAYNHPIMEVMQNSKEIDFSNHFRKVYKEKISYARTYGFLKDLDFLRKNNLAMGGSVQNAMVIDETKITNSSGAYDTAEMVCHKILDVIGDLYTAKMPVLGFYQGYKAGHTLNNQLLNKIFANHSTYTIVEHDGSFNLTW